VSSDPNRHEPPGIPNGWFAVAWSKDLVKGEVKRIRYFDRELVLFRTRSGVPRVLDAYCAHLGAHLAEGGRVMGESIRCPFHAWQYDGDGVVTHIPYCKRIPSKARVRSWDVVERNHLIFVWHHAEDKPPSWEIPAMPEFDDPAWTEIRTFELEVPVHMQDMNENNCDPVHEDQLQGRRTHHGHGGPQRARYAAGDVHDGAGARGLGTRARERAQLGHPQRGPAHVLLHLSHRSGEHHLALGLHGHREHGGRRR
jgi:phenylpropionate dioxygenase-like ring-hydroxylating dioxygenase large terminal subunit